MRPKLAHLPTAFAIALFGVVPLLHSRALNDAVLYPQLLGLVACAGILLAWLYVGKADAPAVPHLAWWPLSALVLWNALSATWALNPAEAGFATARWALLLALLLLSQMVLQRWPETLLTLCKVLIVNLGLLALIGIMQHRGIDPLGLSDKFHSPVSLFANRNFYGSGMVIGLPLVGYGLLQLPKAWRIAGIVTVVLMLLGIVISGTRAALVPLLLGVAIMLPVVVWRRYAGKKRILGLVAWLLLLGLLGWTTQYFLGQKDAKLHYAYIWENGKEVTPQSSSLDFRLIGWHHTLRLAQERPLTGWGAGNWKMQIPRLGFQSYDDAGNFGMVVPLHPHNEFLTTLSELGIPGLLLLLGTWGMGAWGALRLAWQRDSSQDSALGTLLVLGWLAFTVDASFSFPLERPLHLLHFALLLALSMRGYRGRTLTATHLRVALGIAAACLLWAGVNMGARLLADKPMRTVRDAKLAHQPAKVLQAAPKASNWATQIDPAAALSVEWYVAMAQAEMGQPKLAVEAMERAALVSPHSLALRAGHAGMLDIAGRSTEAIALQTELLKTFPQFIEGWLNLSIMQLHAGHYDEARATLLQVPPSDFPDRYLQVDAALRQAGY
jgi:O-antigen ligase